MLCLIGSKYTFSQTEHFHNHIFAIENTELKEGGPPDRQMKAEGRSMCDTAFQQQIWLMNGFGVVNVVHFVGVINFVCIQQDC